MKQTILLIFFLIPFITFGQNLMLEKIDSLMQASHRIGVFNGNVLVAKNGRIIYENSLGYFTFKKDKPLDSNSKMPIGSISKEFNSAGILYLSEKGKLNLTDKVSKYLTNLPDWANEIQILNLLQYTSGLPQINEKSDEDWYARLNSIEELQSTPGKSYEYSNANVFLQKKIIEEVSGLDYYTFIKKKLFRKAKITFAIAKDSILTDKMAHSFDNDFNETSFIHGGEELYMTIADLYNWQKTLHHGKIVSSNSLVTLSKSFDKNSQSSLGFVKLENNNINSHYHDGSGNNYESVLKVDKKNDITIVLMSNNQNFKLGALAEGIQNILENKPYSIPKKSIYLDTRGKILNDFNEGIAFYQDIKSSQNSIYDFDEEVYDLYSTAEYLMRREHYDDAISILHLSTILDLSNKGGVSYAYTLIAECYTKSNRPSHAILYLEKAIELDASNNNAKGMLEKIQN